MSLGRHEIDCEKRNLVKISRLVQGDCDSSGWADQRTGAGGHGEARGCWHDGAVEESTHLQRVES